MKTKNETDSLNDLIILVEQKRAYELELLKEQLYLVSESLDPINLIKNVFHEVVDSPEIKNNLVNSAIGLFTGFISKKALTGNSHNSFKRVLGTLIQFGVTNVVSKHSDDVKTIVKNLFSRFSKIKED